MSGKEYGLLVVTAMLAGLVGGLISNRFLANASPAPQPMPLQKAVLQAGRFEVLDQEGRRRAVLGLVFGKPSLWIANENGEPRVALDLMTNDAPVLLLYGPTGKAKASFSIVQGEPSVTLVDKDGNSVWKAP